MWNVGCFYGNGEELIKKAYADSEESGREYERVVKYVESILTEEQQQRFISNFDDSYLIEELEERGFTIIKKTNNNG